MNNISDVIELSLSNSFDLAIADVKNHANEQGFSASIEFSREYGIYIRYNHSGKQRDNRKNLDLLNQHDKQSKKKIVHGKKILEIQRL
ncbi:16864_t:CDS:2, partial [Entrophospora sp. SA101]